MINNRFNVVYHLLCGIQKSQRTVKHIWFLPTLKANAEKPKELEFLPTLDRNE